MVVLDRLKQKVEEAATFAAVFFNTQSSSPTAPRTVGENRCLSEGIGIWYS